MASQPKLVAPQPDDLFVAFQSALPPVAGERAAPAGPEATPG